MEKIIKEIQNSIIDHTQNNIEYKLTKINNYFVLHIHNPYSDTVNLYDYNRIFFKKFMNSLFERDFNIKDRGCFNHEADDNSFKYKLDDDSLLNNYLKIDFTFILLNKNLEPLCSLSISGNIIYNVCTNFFYRKKGFMTILLKHVLKLIKLKKINNIDYNLLKLTVRKINPIRDNLVKYYEKFGFYVNDDINGYLHMNLN